MTKQHPFGAALLLGAGVFIVGVLLATVLVVTLAWLICGVWLGLTPHAPLSQGVMKIGGLLAGVGAGVLTVWVSYRCYDKWTNKSKI